MACCRRGPRRAGRWRPAPARPPPRRATCSTAAPASRLRSGGGSRTLVSTPTPAPTSVSATRDAAAACAPLTPSTSIALIGTSSRCSPRRSSWPMTRAAAITAPRLHHVRPTTSESRTATRTPATTLSTRFSPVVRVENNVACTTSSAVSGPVSGWVCGNSASATTYAATAARVSRPARVRTARPRRRHTRLALGGCRAHAPARRGSQGTRIPAGGHDPSMPGPGRLRRRGSAEGCAPRAAGARSKVSSAGAPGWCQRKPRFARAGRMTSMSGEPAELHKGLKQRHLTMIAIGGVIGAGLFVGSGVVINETGPGGVPDLRAHRRADHHGDADARRDGRRQPVHRLVRRLRPPGAGRLGRLLGRLAVLVLLGHRRRLRGGRRGQDPHLLDRRAAVAAVARS